MKKVLLVIVALVGLTIVDVGTAQAADGWFRRRSRVTYVPAPQATVAQGQAGTGYRTYSYEPSAGPVMQSYQRRTKVPPYMEAGRHSAGFKLTDF